MVELNGMRLRQLQDGGGPICLDRLPAFAEVDGVAVTGTRQWLVGVLAASGDATAAETLAVQLGLIEAELVQAVPDSGGKRLRPTEEYGPLVQVRRHLRKARFADPPCQTGPSVGLLARCRG
ncbi:hypothetical protein D9M73_105760 [compost metagenome]